MDFSLVGLWTQMGPIAKGVVIILLIMSMYSLGITVERLIAFTRGKKQSMGYIGALAPLVAAAGRLREAVGLDTKFKGSPVARPRVRSPTGGPRGPGARPRGWSAAPG